MTKKDYELIAAAILRSKPAVLNVAGDMDAQLQFAATAISIATALATTNPLFDRARFLAAAGVQS